MHIQWEMMPVPISYIPLILCIAIVINFDIMIQMLNLLGFSSVFESKMTLKIKISNKFWIQDC